MSNKITLVVLAAGMGSRYGGLKQLDELGPNGETILDYSVYDAVENGFDKAVFVIRDFFAEEFKQKVSNKFRDKIEVEHVFQSVNPTLSYGVDVPERIKPWGTNHAVLVCSNVVKEPFAVINADDYYGKDGFRHMAKFLKEEVSQETYAMIGYDLLKTLSDSGTVNRGVCQVVDSHLVDVVETLKIKKDEGGNIYSYENPESPINVDRESIVSMNFWGFHQNYFDYLERGFEKFVKSNYTNPKSEYYIPNLVDDLIKARKAKVKVINSKDNWYGVTYKEDADFVKNNFYKMASNSVYPSPLWQR